MDGKSVNVNVDEDKGQTSVNFSSLYTYVLWQ